MHLRPETELRVGDFDNFFSSIMSGMPEEQPPTPAGGFNNSNVDNYDTNNEDDISGGFGGWMPYNNNNSNMGYEDKSNPLKRSSEEDFGTVSDSGSNKRIKSDSVGDLLGGGTDQSSQGMEGNVLSAELQRVAAFAHQQQMDFSSMNNLDMDLNSGSAGGLGTFGGIGNVATGRPLEPMDSNRQQQPAISANNEMAVMNQTGNNMNQQAFGNSVHNPAFGGSSQNQQQVFGGNNSDLVISQNNGSVNPVPIRPDIQNLQGLSYQLSSMGMQPFLTNMLDLSRQPLANNRPDESGRFRQGMMMMNPSVPTSNSFHPSLMNQQMNMTPSSQVTNQSRFGQIQASSFSNLNNPGTVNAPSADPMSSVSQSDVPRTPSADAASSLGPLDILRLSVMGAAVGPNASLQQQQLQQQLNGMNAAIPSASLQQQQEQQRVFASQQQSNSRGITSDDANNRAYRQLAALPTGQQQQQPIELPQLDTCQPVLPPIEEANTPHYSQRPFHPFSVDEDPNWLSELQCFIRAEILELFRVSQQGIKIRNALKSLKANQVGIRCRYCAHLQHGTRANRASCFPSKIDKIYQSFTMMLREHIPNCTEIPPGLKKRFQQLQNMNAQGASNAKGFWEHAAKKKGLVDMTKEEGGGRGGIHIYETSLAQAGTIIPFGSDTKYKEPQPPVTLVKANDRELISKFLYTLMEQVYRVHLTSSERKGNRKSLNLGMPGFGCRYCYKAGRMGLCRLFPARRRTIHTKIPDLYDHMRRCPLCPQQIKENLIRLHDEDNGGSLTQQSSSNNHDDTSRGKEREFFERIWARLGHQDEAV